MADETITAGGTNQEAPGGQFGEEGAIEIIGTENLVGPAGPQGPAGPKGDTGATGATGATGPRGPEGREGPPGTQGSTGAPARITGASVTTLDSDASATVTTGGTDTDRTFTFGIPRGRDGHTGPAGATGAAATIAVAGVNTLLPGASATVTNEGTNTAASFLFGIPRGEVGPRGPKGDKGDQGADGTDGTPGARGPAGDAARIASITVATLDSDSDAAVSYGGTDTDRTINLMIPRGRDGHDGANGADGTTTIANPTYTGTRRLTTIEIADTDYVLAAGSVTPPATLSVTVTPSATEVEEGFTTQQTITYTVSVNSGFTITSIDHLATQGGNISLSGNVVTVTIPASQNTAQTVSSSFDVNVFRESDSDHFTHHVTQNFIIGADWFTQVVDDSNPSGPNTGAVDQGIFRNGDRATVTGNGTNRLYLWIPTRNVSGTDIVTTSGFDIQHTVGVVSGDHTRLDFGVLDTGTLTLVIREN